MQHREWTYGLASVEQTQGLTTLEVLRAIAAGHLPQAPMSETLQFWLVGAEPGEAFFEGAPHAGCLNAMGTVHGGWMLTVIDSAAACAAYTTMAPGTAYTTLETKANFSRPVTLQSGRVRAHARVVSPGRQIVTAEVYLRTDDDRIVSHGTSTLMVLPPR